MKAIYETLKSNGDKAYLRMKREVMSLDELEHAYIANEQDYQDRKAFFRKTIYSPFLCMFMGNSMCFIVKKELYISLLYRINKRVVVFFVVK
ncbi:hypothetical protein [Paenibacillus peoriae]|uniref:hypothetical protein n=1 Tax=Paenibacillus peoriae TaxID=59893 RepID=UPI00096CDD46|nr:hypothetical protein [Paenibacillus peoriae]OMF34768.1 hypothetical protein BK134_05800 [Paenibacillus peoriae]